MRPHAACKQRGVALLELAIVLPILLILAFGAIEFSLAIAEYKTLTAQARSGARHLSFRTPGDINGRAQAICLVRTGIASNDSCSGQALSPALAAATITVEDAANSESHKAQASDESEHRVRVNLVTVRISGYQYEPVVGSFLSGLTGSATITFDPVSATMRQAL